jgi:hypothetical protein
MADALILVGAISAAATVLLGGIGIGWEGHRLLSTNRCGCGHTWGFADSFGRCTGKTRMRTYSYGRRLGWKWENCGCRKHVAPGMSAPDLSGSERAFVEVTQP